jgi:hypothetical protein
MILSKLVSQVQVPVSLQDRDLSNAYKLNISDFKEIEKKKTTLLLRGEMTGCLIHAK